MNFSKEIGTLIGEVFIGLIGLTVIYILKVRKDNRRIAEAARRYHTDRDTLKEHPSDVELRSAVLEIGRAYARACRLGGEDTEFNDNALMNDINTFAGISVNTPVKARRPDQKESNACSKNLENSTFRLARANGFKHDALDANREGKLTTPQKVKYLAIFTALTVAGLTFATLLIVALGRETGRSEGVWWFLLISLTVLALDLIHREFNALRDYLQGEVVAIRGMVSKDTELSVHLKDSITHRKFTYYYIVNGQRFTVNEGGYEALKEEMNYCLYFLPRSLIFVNIEALDDKGGLPQRPPILRSEASDNTGTMNRHDSDLDESCAIVTTETVNLDYLLAQADAYDAAGQWRNAIKSYEQVLFLEDSKHADIYNQLGTLYEEIDDPGLAEQSYLKALESEPGHTESMLNLGHFYTEQKRFVEALTILQRCARLTNLGNDAHIEAIKLIGEILRDQGEELHSTGWTVLTDTVGLLPAEMTASRLRSEGIPAWAWQEGAGQGYDLSLGPPGTGHVGVMKKDVVEARAILSEDVYCPQCGVELALDETEVKQGWFSCDECGELASIE
jgi:hypothetical protein